MVETMSPFRTILPAPGQRAKQRNTASSSSSSSNTNNSMDTTADDHQTSSPLPHQRPLLKRIRSVPQACHMCRQMKAKCDGARPRCGNCTDRDRPCGYEGEAGQSRQAAMRARLAAYDSLFATLRTASPADAERILQRFRALDDPVALAREEGGNTPPTPTTSVPSPLSAPPLVQAGSSTSPGSSSASPPISGKELSLSPRQSVDNTPNASVIAELVLPDPSTASKALASFFSSCGKLYHVFTEDETNRFCDIVYGNSMDVSAHDKSIASSCLAAVLAVGMQFMPGAFSTRTMNTAYDIAKYNFETIMETSPFMALKTAALLAMFNLMTKNTVALMWIDIGLRLCRANGLTNKTQVDTSITLLEWIQHRKAWRTLVFLSCWLSFTMGSVFGQEVEFERANPADMEVEMFPTPEDIIQTEITKVSILRVEILRVHLAFKEITVLSFESVMRDLTNWQDKLPSQLHLANLQRSNLPKDAMRSAYHLHLVHLGAIMLIYRRMASQYMNSLNRTGGSSMQTLVPKDIPAYLFQEGIDAARNSAKILSLLIEDESLFKHSWIVTMQAFTSCVVLLHSIAQKQLHNFDQNSWQEDASQAQICLRVLDFYSSIDSVAREFYEKLFPIFREMSTTRTLQCACGQGHPKQADKLRLLLNMPPNATTEHTHIPLELISMLSQPFRNLGNKSSMDDVRSSDASRIKLPQLHWSGESRPYA